MPKQYDEWKNLKIEDDPANPFCTKYVFEDGSTFYIEPVFYTMFQSFTTLRPEHYQNILDEMERVVKKIEK